MKSGNGNARRKLMRPHTIGLALLVIVAVLLGDMLLREPDLPVQENGSEKPVKTRQTSPNQPASSDERQDAAATEGVRVIDVPDGDSLLVEMNGRPVRVRLNGVDAPELAQAFGDRSRQLARQLAHGKTVTLTSHGTDQYDRVLATVALPDGRDLGAALVAAGMAWRYRDTPDATLQQLEQQARAENRGLWSKPDPKPPWQWRRENPRR